MKEWLSRHLLLTREERLLVAAILLILLVGLAAWHIRRGESDREVSGAPEVVAPVR